MRRKLAMLLAGITGLLIVLAAVLVALVQEPGAPAPSDDADPHALGRRVYDDRGCRFCHAIAGAGNTRHPLDGVGSRLTAEEIRKWIVTPAAMNPKVRKPAFTDIPPPELDALVAYLRSLPDR